MTIKNGFQQALPDLVIRRAQKGDMDAFEQIYRTYADASYSLALRICGEPSLAQDVMQDAFIKMMNKISHFRFDGAFAGWLRRIVAHETINRIRANSRVHLVGEDELLAGQTSPLFEHRWMEACSDLDKLLTRLSPNARAVLLLHEVEGYNHKEIADLFGKSESFSKVTLYRAFNALKLLIEKQEKRNAFK